MKKKIKYMSFYAFEYKALEEYLRSMARQGWKIVELQSVFKNIMLFEKCTPQDIYYHIDYSAKYGAIEPQIASQDQKEYRDFLKDYGYEIISSYGPLEVYSSMSEKLLPLREENEQSEKDMRKIALKECLLHLPYAMSLCVLIILSNLTNSIFANVWLFINYCYALMIMSMILSVFPYLHYLLHKKEKYDLKTVMTRIRIHQIILFTTLVVPMLFINEVLGWIGIAFEIMFILRKLYTWKQERKSLKHTR